MVAVQSAGGPGGRGAFRQQWRGATIRQAMSAAIQSVMDDLAKEIEATLRSELHRWPKHQQHRLAEEAFAEVLATGGKRTLRAGSAAPYAAYHELGTSTFVGHPQIREIVDRYAAELTRRLQAAARRVA